MNELLLNIHEKHKNKISWLSRKIFLIVKIVFIAYILGIVTDDILPVGIFYKFILVISSIISLRFLLRVFTDTDLNSYFDLLISTSCFYIFIKYGMNVINIDNILNNIFMLNTNSKIFQIFIFHILCVFMVSILVSMAFSIISIILMFFVYGAKIIAEKDIVGLISSIKEINKVVCNITKVDILKIIDDYINPFKKIPIKPLYKNMKLIRNFIFIVYIFVGLLIIFYWNDLVNNVDFKKLIISKQDLETYRVLFIMPLLGIFINKIFNNEKNSNK